MRFQHSTRLTAASAVMALLLASGTAALAQSVTPFAPAGGGAPSTGPSIPLPPGPAGGTGATNPTPPKPPIPGSGSTCATPGCTIPTPPGGGGTPGGNDDVTEIIQSGVQPPVTDGGSGGGNLLGDGGAGGAAGIAGLTPEQLGALAPAAGGNALEGDDSEMIACMNSYLQDGWSEAEMQQKCSGGAAGDDDNSAI